MTEDLKTTETIANEIIAKSLTLWGVVIVASIVLLAVAQLCLTFFLPITGHVIIPAIALGCTVTALFVQKRLFKRFPPYHETSPLLLAETAAPGGLFRDAGDVSAFPMTASDSYAQRILKL